MLIALAGLPGAGKTSLARELARRLGAFHLRMDSIEQAMIRAGLASKAIGPAGYLAGYALATDNLLLGSIVIADSVNPLAATRDGWRAAAADAHTFCTDVEVICSDVAEHRRRVHSRIADISGHELPGWDDVIASGLEYAPWDGQQLTVDTAMASVEKCAEMLIQRLPISRRSK